MDKKERYERETKAKGGSVPPDERHHHGGRSETAKQHLPNAGSSFDKREQAKVQIAKSEEISHIDVEHLSKKAKQAIADRDISP